MNGFPNLPAANMGIGGRRLVLNLLTEWLGILVRRRPGVQRICNPVLLGLAEVIDQQVARDGCYPGDKRSLRAVIARKRAVHLDEDLLGKVFSVIRRSGKAIANVID